MRTQRYRFLVDGVACDVARWYDNAADGDTAVIARAVPPAVWLCRRPHAQVYWWTEGRKGLTISLDDAQKRLAMVQEHGLVL